MTDPKEPLTPKVYIISNLQGNMIIFAFSISLALIVMLMILIYQNRSDIESIEKQLVPEGTQQENQ